MRLVGKTGIVTGGGSGIGRALALAAAGEGARVLICGRREALLRETASRAPSGEGTLTPLALDLTGEAAPERLAGWVRSAGGRLDFLVNGAGISGVNYLDETAGEDGWDRILLTNLTVPYRLCRTLVPFMGRGGRILNISSVLGKFGVPGYSAYCSSKHGIVGMTRALAAELAPGGITVNAICPGWVETEMASAGMARGARRLGISVEEFRREALARVPIGRILQPEEIAPLALYFLSEESAGMTGQAVNLCGGATTA
jgi:NAD(P)-dependent dehydrogenase (short-subunit alcohol dehydrogenase family)